MNLDYLLKLHLITKSKKEESENVEEMSISDDSENESDVVN